MFGKDTDDNFSGHRRRYDTQPIKKIIMTGFSLYSYDAGADQRIITAAVGDVQSPSESVTQSIYQSLDALLADQGLQVVQERVFGKLDFYRRFAGIRKDNFRFEQNPFSYLEGNPCRGSELAGIQMIAVRPASERDYRTIHDNGVPCGRIWKRNDVSYIYLTGLTGSGGGPPDRSKQTARMFDTINRILHSQGFKYTNVVRTWIYLSDILDWYADFNRVRTDKYKEFHIIPGDIDPSEIDRFYLPASTGIGGKNPAGASGISDVLAVNGDVRVDVLPGLSQKSAYRYGSAFSRGLCIHETDHRQVIVSGTASIDVGGNSLHPDNIEGQIKRTLEVVASLLDESGATLADIKSATVFLKRPGDLSVFHKVAESFGLSDLPAIYTIADICREELLFEMDALAVMNS